MVSLEVSLVIFIYDRGNCGILVIANNLSFYNSRIFIDNNNFYNLGSLIFIHAAVSLYARWVIWGRTNFTHIFTWRKIT